jgi:hypothetical protein
LEPGDLEDIAGWGVVDGFAYYYLASIDVGEERRIIYCEHGNQLDPANFVEDYHDRLDCGSSQGPRSNA